MRCNAFELGSELSYAEDSVLRDFKRIISNICSPSPENVLNVRYARKYLFYACWYTISRLPVSREFGLRMLLYFEFEKSRPRDLHFSVLLYNVRL